MNVVDSSGWLEYFADGPNAGFFAPAIEDAESLIVPSITLFEVFKRTLTVRTADAAHIYIQRMTEGRVITLERIAVDAAKVAWEYKLSLADSIIYATARQFDAVLWIQDADFKKLPNVEFREATK